MSYFSKLFLRKVDGTTINPAQEDGNLATLAAVDYATEATLSITSDTITDIKANQTNGTHITKIRVTDETGAESTLLGDTLYQGAPVFIDVAHHEIHCGDSFTLNYNATLNNAANSDILLIVPNESVKRFHLTVNIGTGTELTYNLFEAPTTSANGTALTWYNRERNSALTTGLAAYHTPTVTATGTTAIDGDRFGAKQTATYVNRSEEFVLKTNTHYLLRATNASGNASFISWKLNHYIHPGI